MMVQTANGNVHHLSGGKLPDSISLYSGIPYHGAHAAEVLLSPKDAKGKPLLVDQTGWINKRDATFLVLGMFLIQLVCALAEGVAQAMS